MTSGATTGANPSRLYRNIDETPLAAFVTALCDGDLSALYKGEPPAKRDVQAEKERFRELHAEYSSRMLDEEFPVYENLKRMAMALSSIRILEAALVLAGNGEITDDGILRILRSIGVRLTPDRERNVLMLSSALGKAIRKYREAKEKYEAQIEKGGRQDREYFMSMLAGLSSHFKFAIPFLTTTTGEFCALYRRMKAEVKEMRGRQAQQRKQNDLRRQRR